MGNFLNFVWELCFEIKRRSVRAFAGFLFFETLIGIAWLYYRYNLAIYAQDPALQTEFAKYSGLGGWSVLLWCFIVHFFLCLLSGHILDMALDFKKERPNPLWLRLILSVVYFVSSIVIPFVGAIQLLVVSAKVFF